MSNIELNAIELLQVDEDEAGMSCAERTLQKRKLPPLGRWNRPFTCTRYARKYDAAPIFDERDEEEAVIDFIRKNPDFLEKYVVRTMSRAEIFELINSRKRISSNFLQNRGKMFSTFNRKSIMQAIISDSSSDSSSKRQTDSTETSQLDYTKEKGEAMRKLAQEKAIAADKITILRHLHECLSIGTDGDEVLIYTVNEEDKLLHYFSLDYSDRSFEDGISLDSDHPASTVARTQEPNRLNALGCDEEFKKYEHYFPEDTETIILCPIVKTGNLTVAVVQVVYTVDRPNLTDTDETFVHNMCIWCGTVMNYTDLYHTIRVQQVVNRYILQVTQFMFSNIQQIDEVMCYIMNNTMCLVNATQSAFFIIEEMEFYTHIVDEGDGTGLQVLDEAKCTRYYLDNSITGHVALTGEPLVTQGVVDDPRFNSSIDQRPGTRTNSILCVPVKIDDKVVGVLQLLKHDDSEFRSDAVDNCFTYTIYCGLALQVAKMYEEMRKSRQQYNVAMEVLSYHYQEEEKEIICCKVENLPTKVPYLLRFSYSPWNVNEKNKIINIIYIYRDFFSDADVPGNMKDLGVVSQFILTVRKNHKMLPFHNWDHAYSVVQACYAFVKKIGKNFSYVELMAIFIASLCHDIDYNETVSCPSDVNLSNPMWFFYNTYSRNGSNFNLTATILRKQEMNLLINLSSETYKEVLTVIKYCLAATNFDNFFENKFQADLLLMKKGRHGWRTQEERFVMLGVTMTSLDLCVFYKPWEIHQVGVVVEFERLHNLPPIDRKKYGVTLDVMDPDKIDCIPEYMVTFMNNICLPTYLLIGQMFPKVSSLAGFCRIVRTKWMEISRLDRDKRKKEYEDIRDNVLGKAQNAVQCGQTLNSSFPNLPTV